MEEHDELQEKTAEMEVEENLEAIKPRNRKRKKGSTTSKSRENENLKPKKRGRQKSSSRRHEMSWICAECNEAEPPELSLLSQKANDKSRTSNQQTGLFLICDGPCERIFHMTCVGLSSLPKGEWKCHDCQVKRHLCSWCQQYGQDMEDVFPCDDCGLFFHESCLLTLQANPQMQMRIPLEYKTTCTIASPPPGQIPPPPPLQEDVLEEENKDPSPTSLCLHKQNQHIDPVDVNNPQSPQQPKQNGNSTAITTTTAVIPKFTCPAHFCWTCSQDAMLDDLTTNDNDEQTNNGQAASSQRKAGRKKKKKTVVLGPLMKKKEPTLIRCLLCPIAYHISCIPPAAAFHELALLCHEHAGQNKLPDLDMEHSLQNQVEEEVEKVWQYVLNKTKTEDKSPSQQHKQLNIAHAQDDRYNPFAPGVVANFLMPHEKELNNRLISLWKTKKARNSGKHDDDDDEEEEEDDEDESNDNNEPGLEENSWFLNNSSMFCLPCDYQTEVDAKPPAYKHIHNLKYDSINRPKKIPPPCGDFDRCSCKVRCDELCMNRLLMMECFDSNCSLGPNCGNRDMGGQRGRQNPAPANNGSQKKKTVSSLVPPSSSKAKRKQLCQPKRERGKGWGLVTTEKVQKGQFVLEYLGEVIGEQEKEERLRRWSQEHPNDFNFYVMSLGKSWYIDARKQANLSRFINHSCNPNCTLRTVWVAPGSMHNGIYALRDIEAGEFLSYDYQFDTRFGDKFICRCGSQGCRGTMTKKSDSGGDNSSPNDMDGIASKLLVWQKAKAQYDRDRQFLLDLQKREEDLLKVQSPALPGTNDVAKREFVSNGISDLDRMWIRKSGVFLYRNATLGSNFGHRWNLLSQRNGLDSAKPPATTNQKKQSSKKEN